MGDTTLISWCDKTHNHWVGCTKVSNGPLGACEHCYAENMMATRFGRVVWGGPGQGVGTRALTSEANRRKPLGWETQAKRAVDHWRSNPFARPETPMPRPFVFCNSLADVFDNEVPIEWLRELVGLWRTTPHLIWLALTKRPQLIAKRFREACPGESWPANTAIGCTVVTQEEVDRDIPHLLRAKEALSPAFAFLSMEPLMGPVDLDRVYLEYAGAVWVDWVIAGGETDQGGRNARPSHPDWFRALRDQCAWAGVPFHFKQWGSWHADALLFTDTVGRRPPPDMRIGPKAAGRTLDGVIHDARPDVRPTA